MVDLFNYIDNRVGECVSGVRSFGLCHLLEGDNEKFPATVEKRATKATPDDKYLVNMYHRLLNSVSDNRDDISFGKRRTTQNNQKVRTVVFVKMGQSFSLVDDIFNALPDSFTVDGYDFANVNKGVSTIIRDRAQIWNDEFQGAYKDKYQMVWMVYAIEYDLQYVKCNVCV